MKHLYFVRHGETEANIARQWSGLTETPLTATGRSQAKLAGIHAKDLGIDHIICSTLGRAHNTAEIIAREIGYPVDKIERNSLFVERSFGHLEGQVDDLDTDIDGFIDVEARDTLFNRARIAVRYLETVEADSVLVVSHSGFGRALRHVLYPDEHTFDKTEQSPRIPNAEIFKLV